MYVFILKDLLFFYKKQFILAASKIYTLNSSIFNDTFLLFSDAWISQLISLTKTVSILLS